MIQAASKAETREAIPAQCTCKQNFGDEITAEQWSSIDDVIARFRNKPGALIPVLEEVQGIAGYLPEVVQRRVAAGLKLPLAQVYGVVTFYSFFSMTPKGRHPLRVCLGTACHVRGGQIILGKIEQALGIKEGEVTSDREFSLDVVRCLGACVLAPVMMVGEDTPKQVKAAKIDRILDTYREGSTNREE